MSTDNCVASTSLKTASATNKLIVEVEPCQIKYIAEIKLWLDNTVKFRARTEDEFILMFLHGCKFDISKTKKKLTKYYENRRKVPQWLAHRDLADQKTSYLLRLSLTTALIENDPGQPTIIITTSSRLPKEPDCYDHYLKLDTIRLDVIMKRRNSQLNGLFWIVDCRDHPTWYIKCMMSPFAMPMRIKGVILLNASPVIIAVWKLIKPFLSLKLRQRVYFYDSSWCKLNEHIPNRFIPQEYGGTAGPLSIHDDAFVQEVLSHSDYITEDNQYGYQKIHDV